MHGYAQEIAADPRVDCSHQRHDRFGAGPGSRTGFKPLCAEGRQSLRTEEVARSARDANKMPTRLSD